MSILPLFLAVLAAFSCFSSIGGYKYLGIVHFNARSHYIVCSSLLKSLAKKGHEVTVIAPFKESKPIKNYREIYVPDVGKPLEASKSNMFNQTGGNVMKAVIGFHQTGVDVSEALLQEPAVQALLKSNETFDAIIQEIFLGEALYGFSDHFNAPLIGLSTFGAITWNTDMIGSPSPPSYVPNYLMPFSNHMTLTQRIGNLAYLTFERLFTDYFFLPRMEAVYKRYFPNAKRSMYEVRRNAALSLLNTHVSLAFPRPYVPNQIEVGGMHINRQQHNLPANLKEFIEGAPHGAIYFSMGSNLKSKDMPEHMLKDILAVFRGLKQRVLWKFEKPNLPGKPDNVLISDWFPQDAILAHPNVKLFITHGGLLSTTETIYHGKPVVGIPIFGDQFLNMQRAEAMGYGITVHFATLSKETLGKAVQRVLEDPSFMKRVKEMSERYRDQESDPMEKAIWWVEHIVRHKGAKYLHCAGQDLSFVEYHNIDVLSIIFGAILLVIFMLYWLLKSVMKISCWLLGKVFSKSAPKKSEKAKRQ